MRQEKWEDIGMTTVRKRKKIYRQMKMVKGRKAGKGSEVAGVRGDGRWGGRSEKES